MAYCTVNFKTKKALRDAVLAGKELGVYQPGPFGLKPVKNGPAYLEGPWYPQPHKWWAAVEVRDGVIVSVR